MNRRGLLQAESIRCPSTSRAHQAPVAGRTAVRRSSMPENSFSASSTESCRPAAIMAGVIMVLIPRCRYLFYGFDPPHHTGEVHWGQRVALIEIVDTQYGHSFVVGAAPGAGWSTALLMRFTCLISRNTAKATMRNPITSLRNWPYAMTGIP